MNKCIWFIPAKKAYADHAVKQHEKELAKQG